MMKAKILLLLLVLPFSILGKAQDVVAADMFFKDTDFSDTSIVRSEVFAQQLTDFVYQYYTRVNASEMDYIIALSPLFKKAKTNMAVYEFMLGFMLNGFSNLEMKQVTDYLLRFPAIRENEVDAAQGKRLEAIAEPYQLVKVGAQAPDFSGLASNGESYRLYDSDAQFVLVAFWSTGCDLCHAFLKQIRRHSKTLKAFELVTFAIAEDEADWRAALDDTRLDGFHFFDGQRWSGDAITKYHVTTAPTVFVIDANKTIVCKAMEWDELKEWMKNNKNQ